MLYRRECELIEYAWSPVHTVSMELPDNIVFEDIRSAIDFIYKTDNSIDPLSCIYGLTYLLAEGDVIIKLIKKKL